MPIFELLAVPQVIVKTGSKPELRAEVRAEFRTILRYLLGSSEGVSLHLWSDLHTPTCRVAYEVDGQQEDDLVHYLNKHGRLLRVVLGAEIPALSSTPIKLHRSVDLIPVGAIDRIDRFENLPILPLDAPRYTNFDPNVMGQSTVGQVLMAPVTQMVGAFVRDRWTPSTAYLAPTPRTISVRADRDFAWRSTLGVLAQEGGRVTIECRPLKHLDVLADYALLCLQYMLGSHGDRLSSADIASQTAVLRDVTSKKTLFDVEICVWASTRLRDAFLQDNDTEAFQVRPTVLERALMRRGGTGIARPAQAKKPLRGPGETATSEGSPLNKSPVQMLGNIIELDHLCDLLTPPYTLSDALPGVRHFVPRPFQDPFISPLDRAGTVTLGRTLNGQELRVPSEQLTRHTFVTGASGSGKTNTLYGLVEQLHQLGTPVLLIDPAKRDFEPLMHRLGCPTMIFDFRHRWLRFNPFIPPSNITLYAHSVMLAKTLSMLFPTNAVAYEMLLSMVKGAYWEKLEGERPADQALNIEFFVQKTGQDLISNPHLAPTFPEFLESGLAGLRASAASSGSTFMRDAVEHFERRWQNMRRSLLSIVFSPSTPGQRLSPLFSTTALIELGGWFDKDEANAAFALFFGMLYEERLSGYADTRGDAPLRHVAVLDEAHRIVPGRNSTGDAQLMSAEEQTSDLLSQMIAECRALGQGLIFAEQSASSIASSVLVNTSTKIVHSVVFGRDKDFLQSALSLSDEERDYLSYLSLGEALTFTSRTYQPLLVRVPSVK